jgi:hypothetical protein
VGLPRGDLALELLSWTGVFLSMLLATSSTAVGCWAGLPAALWAMYLSLINLEPREVIGYGWEWETVEIGFLMIFLCPVIPRSVSWFSWEGGGGATHHCFFFAANSDEKRMIYGFSATFSFAHSVCLSVCLSV